MTGVAGDELQNDRNKSTHQIGERWSDLDPDALPPCLAYFKASFFPGPQLARSVRAYVFCLWNNFREFSRRSCGCKQSGRNQRRFLRCLVRPGWPGFDAANIPESVVSTTTLGGERSPGCGSSAC